MSIACPGRNALRMPQHWPSIMFIFELLLPKTSNGGVLASYICHIAHLPVYIQCHTAHLTVYMQDTTVNKANIYAMPCIIRANKSSPIDGIIGSGRNTTVVSANVTYGERTHIYASQGHLHQTILPYYAVTVGLR